MIPLESARFPASLLSLFCDKDTKLSRRSTTLILSREKQWRRKRKIGHIYLSAGYDTLMPIPNRSRSNRISWLTSCHACLNTLFRNHHLPRERDPSPYALSSLIYTICYLLSAYSCLRDITFTSSKYLFVDRIFVSTTLLELYRFSILIITSVHKYMHFVSQYSENLEEIASLINAHVPERWY